jgi:hypothetical protein
MVWSEESINIVDTENAAATGGLYSAANVLAR